MMSPTWLYHLVLLINIEGGPMNLPLLDVAIEHAFDNFLALLLRHIY